MVAVERRIQYLETCFGADDCDNADRVMRLPGTLNVLSKRKIAVGRKPALAEVVEFHDTRIYNLEDFPEVTLPPCRPVFMASPQKFSNAEIQRMRDALQAIPADDYDTYLKILMATKNALGDSGFWLAREWAMKSVKFDENDIRGKWESIEQEGGVTVATLFFMAQHHGWKDRSPVGLRKDRGVSNAGSADECSPHGEDLICPDMSVVKRNRTPGPTFPTDVFGNAEEWVKDTAASKSAPVDYVALALLVVASGTIGAKRRVSPWSDWEEPSVLWGGLVGEPSCHKSPSIDPIRDAVRTIESLRNADWAARQLEHETKSKIAGAHRSAWEDAVKAAVKEKKAEPPMPEEAAAPDVPKMHRCWIGDSTTEQIARMLGENPSGLICFRDELAGLFGSFDRYGGSGNDRAFWLEAYGGRSYRFDRVNLKGESINIPFCAVSLLGGLQPDRLNTLLLCGDDDGLAARMLYAWPDPVVPRRPARVPDPHSLQAALQRLSDLPFEIGSDGTLSSRVVLLESDAADEFQSWWEGKQWAMKLDAAGRLAGAIGKLDGVTLRIAQTLEFLAWAWGRSNEPEPARIGILSVLNALRIIEEWVRPTLARVFAEAALPQAQRDAAVVARWLLKNKRDLLNSREMRRTPGFPGPKESHRLDAAIEVLVDARWLVPVARAGPGRKPKDFAVNMAIFEKAEE
ncbi:MAG: DUF3987 domain-containing protein [Proteobacteria bacterium]|nr:DUF3987 domain-containing protein [Pseudomonadota bacterium]